MTQEHEAQMRLDCLRLAASSREPLADLSNEPDELVRVAGKFADFVLGDSKG